MVSRKQSQVRERNMELFWQYYRAKQSNPKRVEKLKAQLIQENEGLAITIASRLKDTCGEPLEDLVQLAMIGLAKAVDRFDPTRDNAFSSFAVKYIAGEIKHFTRDHWNGARVSRRWVELHSKALSVHRRLTGLGRSISLDEVAINLMVQKKATRSERDKAAQRWGEIKQALHRKPSVQLEENVHQPFIADETRSGSIEEEFKPLYTALAHLPEPHHSCVVERFFEQLSEETIATRHQLSIERVQELLTEGLEFLQYRMAGLD